MRALEMNKEIFFAIFAFVMIFVKIYIKRGQFYKNVILGIIFKIKNPNDPVPDEILQVLKQNQSIDSEDIKQGTRLYFEASKKGSSILVYIVSIGLILLVFGGITYIYFQK